MMMFLEKYLVKVEVNPDKSKYQQNKSKYQQNKYIDLFLQAKLRISHHARVFKADSKHTHVLGLVQNKLLVVISMSSRMRFDRGLDNFASTSVKPGVLVQLSIMEGKFDIRTLQEWTDYNHLHQCNNEIESF